MKNKTETMMINGYDVQIDYLSEKRKSISLTIISSSCIEIKRPHYVGINKAKEFLNKKTKWITNKLAAMRDAEKNGCGRGLYNGRKIFYFGSLHEVIAKGEQIHVAGKNIYIPMNADIEHLELWYKNESCRFVETFIKKMTVKVPEFTIKVKKQKKIWGSCNTKNQIYINSKISMCSPEVIEYILWHEICHLVHMNHSPDFYSLLKVYCPEYKKHKMWLKKNGMNLRI